jgi:hypothetical protein
MRVRKKPVEVDAIRYLGEWPPIMEWLDQLAGGQAVIPFGTKPLITRDPSDGTLKIETLEGVMTAQSGDWIICGVTGELYPCKAGIFDQTYEPVDRCGASSHPGMHYFGEGDRCDCGMFPTTSRPAA